MISRINNPTPVITAHPMPTIFQFMVFPSFFSGVVSVFGLSICVSYSGVGSITSSIRSPSSGIFFSMIFLGLEAIVFSPSISISYQSLPHFAVEVCVAFVGYEEDGTEWAE